MSRAWSVVVSLCLTFAAASPRAEGPYPSKPIRLVVPTAVGGAADIAARRIAPKLAQALGQQVVVDNRGGAGGQLAGEIVAKAEPDGHTLLFATSVTHAIAPALYHPLNYEPIKDFAPITVWGYAPMILVARPSLGAANFHALVKLAKAKSASLNYGAMTASPPHVVAEILSRRLGLELTHVPYKGDAPALADLLAGQIDLAFQFPPPSLPQIQAGKLVALLVTGAKRHPALPDVPSVAELGLEELEMIGWSAFTAPAKTPPEIIARLNQELAKIRRDPEIGSQVQASGGFLFPETGPEQTAAFFRAEFDKFKKLVQESGAKPD